MIQCGLTGPTAGAGQCHACSHRPEVTCCSRSSMSSQATSWTSQRLLDSKVFNVLTDLHRQSHDEQRHYDGTLGAWSFPAPKTKIYALLVQPRCRSMLALQCNCSDTSALLSS